MFLRAAGAWPVNRQSGKPFRSFRPLLASFRHGPEFSPSGQSLNPLFAEWLMGWPLGWTDCEVPVTGFAHWLRRSRMRFCALISAFDAGA